MTSGLQLGRPGIYPLGERDPGRMPGVEAVRLDETGFVGVALRGATDTPLLVASWSDYVRNFGAFERAAQAPDRLLPYAVQAFFAQGGERAWVLRVAPAPDWDGDDAETATARFQIGAGSDAAGPTAPGLAAANEGTWGTSLRIRLGFEVLASFDTTVDDDGGIKLPTGAAVAPWSLLRLRAVVPPGLPQFGWVAGERRSELRAGGRSVVLETPLGHPPGGAVRVDVVTAVLESAEPVSASAPVRRERIGGLGLRPGHPRFLPEILANESSLLRGTGSWDNAIITPDLLLTDIQVLALHPGSDRSPGINFKSFFDDGPADQDPLDEAVHRGVDAMGRESRMGLLCVPDLFWRAAQSAAGEPEPRPAPPRPPGSCQDPCGHPGCCAGHGGYAAAEQPEPNYAPSDDAAPGLDARVPADLSEILERQLRLVEVAELRHRFVALLDVPAGLSQRQIHDWRAGFSSSYAAAYFPWLGVPRTGTGRPAIIQVPPSSFAAGIIAARERQRGLSWGPANTLAAGALRSAEVVSDATHDALHGQGINVYRQERDGLRLSAARTLSTDPEYVQLSVRRLMTMLALALARQGQWLVFEPNTAQLRDSLQRTVTEFLREQHRGGALAGNTEEESFFVRCDDGLNPPQSQGMGRLVAEIGVAPASPLEYLVLRIFQDVDGTLQVQSPGQGAGNG